MTAAPIATVKAYRRTGGAVVKVERNGRTRRYVISLQRYRALTDWVLFGGHQWRTSGAFMRSSITAYLWPDAPAGSAS